MSKIDDALNGVGKPVSWRLFSPHQTERILADEVRRLRAENARLRVVLLEAVEWDGYDDTGVPALWLKEARAALAEAENPGDSSGREEPDYPEREQWLRQLLADAVGLLHHHEEHKDPQWDKDYAWLTMQYDALLAELDKERSDET